MNYPLGCDRCLKIILLLALILRVDGHPAQQINDPARQDFAVNGGGQQSWSLWPAGLLSGAQGAFGSLGRETVNASNKMLWGVGKFLLSAGESINYMWDVAVKSMLGLLRTGGTAYRAIASKIANVPIIGYGASGVGHAIDTSLTTAERTATYDMHVRKEAFATLNAKLNESGKRLSGSGEDYGTNVRTSTIGIRCVPADESAAAGGQKALPTVQDAIDGTRSSLTAAGQQLMKSGSEAVSATEQGLKAIGRATMAVAGLLVSGWNAVSQTAAVTGSTVAKGYEKVNQVVDRVPVLGTITTGLQHTLTGTTGAISQATMSNSEIRVKLVNDLRSKLDEFQPLKRNAEGPPAAAT